LGTEQLASPAVAGELAIRRSLLQPASVNFDHTPLAEAVRYLSEKYGVQIVLDQRGFNEAGINPSVPVTLTVKDVSLKSILSLVVEQVPGIAWNIRYELVQFTTEARANAQMTTKVYNVREILGDDLAAEMDGRALSDTIQSHIAPDSWSSSGGAASISATGAKKSEIVVTQTWQRQEEIIDLILRLRAAHKPPPKPGAIFGPVPPAP
jgi:hypothetical protein